FGGQLSFNLLPEPATAQRVEDRISKQLASLMGETFPSPLIHALQAPVFHGHGFSVFVRLLEEPALAELRTALSSDSTFMMHEPDDPPSPVSTVGTHGIHVGRVTSFSEPGTFGLWMVADNLRIAASNAIRTAENIMLAAIGR